MCIDLYETHCAWGRTLVLAELPKPLPKGLHEQAMSQRGGLSLDPRCPPLIIYDLCNHSTYPALNILRLKVMIQIYLSQGHLCLTKMSDLILKENCLW